MPLHDGVVRARFRIGLEALRLAEIDGEIEGPDHLVVASAARIADGLRQS
jgi:hypothetical protein